MLNQLIFAAFLAVTTVTTTMAVHVPSSYAKPKPATKLVEFCIEKQCLRRITKPVLKRVIPAVQQDQNQRQNQQYQQLRQQRRQQLRQQQQYIQLPQTRTTP